MAKLADLIPERKVKHTATIWTIDIERFPMEAYVWSPKLRSGYIAEPMVKTPSRMVSFSALRDDGLMVFSSEFHHGRDKMLETLYSIMSSCDIAVGFNSQSFDVPHIDMELFEAGFAPYLPVKHIDLMRAAKRRFRFDYNGLGSIARRLGLTEKLETNVSLWRRCMDGDPAAWDEMKRYNNQDVRVTDALRKRMAPWIPNHPNIGLWAPDEACCPVCAGTELVRAGTVNKRTLAYPAYRCQGCGALVESKHITARAQMRPVVV